MSQLHNHEIVQWRKMEAKLSSYLEVGNPDLSRSTIIMLSEAIVLTWTMVPVSYDSAVWRKSLYSHLPVFGKIAIREIASAYKVVLSKLLNHDKLSCYNNPDGYTSFKRSLVVTCPLIGMVLAPLSDIIESILHGSTDAADFRTVLQYFGGWTRIQVSEYDYTEVMLSEYRANEQHLSQLSIPDPILFYLNKIIKEWFKDYEADIWNFKHGPGAISGVKGRPSLATKFNLMGTDELLYYVTREIPHFGVGSPLRTSEVVFVPKTMLTDRTICKEPVTLQYYQQGIWHSLKNYVRNHPILRSHIHFNDQSFNRDAAWKGSIYMSRLGTTDLSSASDLVSVGLVRRLFANTPLFPWLFATRSNKVKLPQLNEVLSIQKFAPMGSALCFPIECIVFASICELAYRITGLRGLNDYLVYGDDIVADTRVTNLLHDLLDVCGFKVNPSKSFTRDSCLFRESCGGEFFNGEEITPLKLPRNFVSWDINLMKDNHPVPSTWYSQRIALANNMLDRGMRIPRSLVTTPLLQLPKSLKPLFDDGRSGLKSPNPMNHHLDYYPNYDYYGIELRHGRVIAIKDDDRNLPWFNREDIRLFEWLRASRDRDTLCQDDKEFRVDPLRPWVRSSRTIIT